MRTALLPGYRTPTCVWRSRRMVRGADRFREGCSAISSLVQVGSDAIRRTHPHRRSPPGSSATRLPMTSRRRGSVAPNSAQPENKCTTKVARLMMMSSEIPRTAVDRPTAIANKPAQWRVSANRDPVVRAISPFLAGQVFRLPTNSGTRSPLPQPQPPLARQTGSCPLPMPPHPASPFAPRLSTRHRLLAQGRFP